MKIISGGNSYFLIVCPTGQTHQVKYRTRALARAAINKLKQGLIVFQPTGELYDL